MIEAIGFDLGETLIYSKDTPLSWQGLYRQALSAVSDQCGCNPGDVDFQAAELILARYNTRLNPRTREYSSDTIFSELLQVWGLSPALYLSIATEAFFSFFHQDNAVYDDVIPALTHLRSLGIPIGILTDVPYGMPRRLVELSVAPFAEHIDVLLTSVDAGFRKPDATGYLDLARRLGVNPQEMAYIGNEPKDIEVAKTAGSTAIFLDRDNTKASYGQDLRISSLHELSALTSLG